MRFVNEPSQTNTKNFYQVGNVIKSGESVYLVIYDANYYMLVSLTDNTLMNGIHGNNKFTTLEELADEFAQSDDELLTGKLSFIAVAHHN